MVDENEELKEIYNYLYFFEVQRLRSDNTFEHVGYMEKLFRTAEDAWLFFQKYNPNVKIYKTNITDWNADTLFRYRLHNYHRERLTIEPFDGNTKDLIWRRPFSPIGTVVELGKAMQASPLKPVAEFPLCSGKDCWCYNCSITEMMSKGMCTYGIIKDSEKLLALRNAKEKLKEYKEKSIKSNGPCLD
jgi:hypothetical protein